MLGKALKTGFGGVGGALMGGAGLIGAGLISATGAGKYVAGGAAIAAGAKKGADWLGSKSFGGADSEDKTVEELGKVTEYGLLSVEKLDAIYDNVLDMRKALASDDPESQAAEEALDEKRRNEQLIKSIRGMGGKSGGDGPVKKDFDWAKLLGLGALGSLLFLDDDDLKNFFEKAPEWAESINEAVDNIMEFVKDLDGFFEGLGIEFAGAAILGTGAGMRKAGRSKMIQSRRAQIKARKAADKARADARKKAEAAAKKKQELRQNRNAAKTQRLQRQLTRARLAAAQAQKAYQALLDEQAETKRQARQSRQQKSKTRAGRIKNVAKVAASKFVSKMSRIGGRPGGAPVKPSGTSAGTKVSTPKRGGRIARGLTALTPKITSTPKRGGRIARGFTALTPKIAGLGDKAKKMFGREGSNVKGGMAAPTSRSRPGPPKKPKIPPKVALALQSLPAGALKFLGLKEVTEETGLKGEEVPKTKESLKARLLRGGGTRLLGPLILLYELSKLMHQWKTTSDPADKNPFGGDEADRVFKVGLARLAASYGAGYFGAMAGAMAGMMIGGPFVSAALGLSGGFVGAVFGDLLMSRALETNEEEINRKKSKLAKLGREIEVMHQTGMSNQAMGFERDYDKLAKEISVLEAAGPTDEAGGVVIIQANDNSQTHVKADSVQSVVHERPALEPIVVWGYTDAKH